jgi:hypothetical protein
MRWSLAMTAVPDFDQFRLPVPTRLWRRERPVYEFTETYWGYRIDGRRAPAWLIGFQVLCWGLGVALVIASVGIWVVPGSDAAGGLVAFKLGASVPMAAVAALLLWQSSRGTMVGVEVDLRLGEVREVLSNRAGRTAVMARYGFDAIGGVSLDRNAVRGGGAQLVLRYRGTAQVLAVAQGPEIALAGLRDRLGRDLMVGRRKRAEVEQTVAPAADTADATEVAAAA